ncbi:MAG: serine/threonine-protein kinase [Thermoguttaceae bacterium]|jgi:hypothetical protein
MSAASNTPILTLSNTQAKDLAGNLLTVGAETLRFRAYDPRQPGQPPWRSGAEGKAYPLLRLDGSAAAYMKFFTRPSRKRLQRTAWLIGQQIHAWLPGLAAAPLFWAETCQALRPTELGFDFAGYLTQAVPGETWLELKNRITDAGVSFPEDLRWRSATDLIRAAAVLERAQIVHGDLSPNNIVIDLDAPPAEPALHLIDFDAFAAPAAGASQTLTVAEGGSYGTEGYCPPDLAAAASTGDMSIAPYSDRYGRDMLLLELLFMDRGLPSNDPPARWNRDPLQRRYVAWRARCGPACGQALAHLEPATAFSLAEDERPASTELAAALGLRLPEMHAFHRAVPPRHATLAILERRAAVVEVDRLSRQPTPAMLGQTTSRRPVPPLLQTVCPRRWQRPPPSPSLWDDLRVVFWVFGWLWALLLFAPLIALIGNCRADIHRQKTELDRAEIVKECKKGAGVLTLSEYRLHCLGVPHR